MTDNLILSNFPQIKRSYENIIHKKVYNADIIFAIPAGRKCFAWFTECNGAPICWIIESHDNNQLTVVGNYKCCFNRDLSYGTIVYGTLFYCENNTCFTMEDIFHYKGRDLTRDTWGEKFNIISRMLARDMKQVSYNRSFLIFGAPLVSNTVDSILELTNAVRYKISTIQFRSFTNSNHLNYIRYTDLLRILRENPVVDEIEKPVVRPLIKPVLRPVVKSSRPPRELIFNVKPDIQNDIYHLFCSDNEFYEYACVPDYKTSVLLNKLFRNIKENTNLDALEESDDEDEFENEKKDRFVFLDRSYNMVCAYNPKFKKWYPVRVAEPNAAICNINVHKK